MAAAALAQHYIEYLSSPAVLLTIAVVVAPILFTLLTDWIAASKTKNTAGIPGCRLIGLKGRSNLRDQYEDYIHQSDDKPRVRALFTYPVKSCRGVELGVSQVESLGLSYDRLFTFARRSRQAGDDDDDDDTSSSRPAEKTESGPWTFMTERDFPRLAMLETELWIAEPRKPPINTPITSEKSKASRRDSTVRKQELSRTRGRASDGKTETVATSSKQKSPKGGYFAENGGCLVVRFPYSPSFNPLGFFTETVVLQLPLRPTPERAEAKQYTNENVKIWKDCPRGINMTNEIDEHKLAKLKSFLGVSSALAIFRRDDRDLRPISRSLPPGSSTEDFKVGFSDAFPVNIVGLPSIRNVDKDLPANASAKNHLDARRFRANIYLTGTLPFAEDKWKRITLGRRIGRDQQGLFETEAEYHIACRTARCTLPNVDPATGLRDRNEPYTTLSKTRNVDEGAKPFPCLGMQMIPLFQRGVIRVGDEVEVLETGEHLYEKMLS